MGLSHVKPLGQRPGTLSFNLGLRSHEIGISSMTRGRGKKGEGTERELEYIQERGECESIE